MIDVCDKNCKKYKTKCSENKQKDHYLSSEAQFEYNWAVFLTFSNSSQTHCFVLQTTQARSLISHVCSTRVGVEEVLQTKLVRVLEATPRTIPCDMCALSGNVQLHLG